MRRIGTLVVGLGCVALLAACGGEEKEPERVLSQGERCVIAQQQAQACVESYCAGPAKDSKFCTCYAEELDLDLGSCGCTLVTYWELHRHAICEERELPNHPHLDCASLGLEETYGGACEGP